MFSFVIILKPGSVIHLYKLIVLLCFFSFFRKSSRGRLKQHFGNATSQVSLNSCCWVERLAFYLLQPQVLWFMCISNEVVETGSNHAVHLNSSIALITYSVGKVFQDHPCRICRRWLFLGYFFIETKSLLLNFRSFILFVLLWSKRSGRFAFYNHWVHIIDRH